MFRWDYGYISIMHFKKWFFYNEALQSVGGSDITQGWNLLSQENDPTLDGLGETYKKHEKYYKNAVHKIIIPELTRILSRSDEFPLHIYFGWNKEKLGDNKDSFFNIGSDRNDFSDHVASLKNYFFEELKIPKDHIVYVKAQSGGDIWKPWMILHGLGHAILGYTSEGRSVFKSIRQIINAAYYEHIFKKFIKNASSVFEDESPLISFISEYSRSNSLKGLFFSSIFTFNSAQSTTQNRESFQPISSYNEFSFELIPWFFYNGCKIPKPKKDSVYDAMAEKIISMSYNVDDSYYDGEIFTGNEADKIRLQQKISIEIKVVIEKMLSDIEMIIRKMLNGCRGKVLVD